MHRPRTRTLTSLAFAALLLLPALNAVGQTVAEPRPVRKGFKRAFTINSTPQTATIFLDDRKYGVVGYTPFKVTLTDGDYKLILELKGYKTEERTLRVQKGIAEQLVVLQREIAPGTLKLLAADPSLAGAYVSVDGQIQGTAPRDVKVPVGRHLVELTRDGYLPLSQWVEVEEGQVVALSPSLKPIVADKPLGSLLVDSTPNGADVSVDGRPLADKTPTVVDGLAEGVHVVEIVKPPAKAFKDTVFIKGGERAKLTATLQDPTAERAAAEKAAAEKAVLEKALADKAAAEKLAAEAAEKAAAEKAAAERSAEKAVAKGPAAGALTVKANVDGAEVLVDGARRGVTPLTLSDLSAGAHAIEVRAADHGAEYRKVSLEAGAPMTVQVTLAMLDRATKGLVRVVSPQPEAAVFIDGAKAGVSPVEKELAAGKHFIMVRKEGFADYTKEITVVAGVSMDLTANLLPGGGIRVVASREGAKVSLDGKSIGVSPAEVNNVEAGEHIVSVELAGFEEYRTKVAVNSGERAVVNADLKAKNTGPSREELRIRQRGLSTWGARPMAFGNFAIDVSGGYPVWGEVRATVGVSDAKLFGWDLGLGLRTYTNNWDLYLTGRTRFFQAGPFSLGAFGLFGGGAGMNGRNSILGQAGALASINLADVFTITARFYGDFWSDQLCAKRGSADWKDGKGMAACYAEPADPEKQDRIKQMTGETDSTQLADHRDDGARFYLSLGLEGAITQNFSLFLVVEGAPGQGERAMHSEIFNSRLFAPDQIYNGRLGFTFKY